MEAVVYQCPNCGAPLEFNSETQRWDCKFCLSSFEKEQLEQMTDEIEQNLQNSLEREITTDMVGEQVMDKLREVDEVAYVRFASVYRQFKDINTFMSELNKLLSEK